MSKASELLKLMEKEDGLKRLQKRIASAPISKDKDVTLFIVGELVPDGEQTAYQTFTQEFRKELKGAFGLMATTDEPEEDGEDEYNYYAFETKASSDEAIKAIKKLNKKYKFYYSEVNGKQVKL